MTTPELESVAIALWRNDDTGCDWEDQDDDERAFYISQARAALSAIREPMSDWQPIETAPKDGRKMLLRFTGPFSDQMQDGVTVGRWLRGWWLDAIWATSTAHRSPTHWMPLPPPPKTEPTT